MGRPVRMRPAGALVVALAAGAAGCIDFVAVEDPRGPGPEAFLNVRSVEEGDSLVVTLHGELVGFADPVITLAGVRASEAGRRGDTLAVEATVVLPSSASRADLVVPFAAEAKVGGERIRVGMVRRAAAASLEEDDLVLPWAGPQPGDETGSWSLTLRGEGPASFALGGSGAPPRPLRVPLRLLGGLASLATAELRLHRRVPDVDTFYPLDLHLQGHTGWDLRGLRRDP